MVTSNGLLRIFWPNGLPRTTTPGVIVGWRNSDYDLFVVTILEDVEVGQSYRSDPNQSKYHCRFGMLKMLCGPVCSSATAAIRLALSFSIVEDRICASLGLSTTQNYLRPSTHFGCRCTCSHGAQCRKFSVRQRPILPSRS